MLYKNLNFSLLTILLIGITLRIYGINFGLPLIYDGDEYFFVSKSMKMVITGDLNPHWFGHPASNFMYLLAFLYFLFYLFGSLTGRFSDLESFKIFYETDPTIFYLIGRGMSTFFAIITIIILYKFTKRIWNKDVAILSCLFLAVSPLHSQFSQLVRGDILFTLLIISTIYSCVLLMETNKIKYLILTGFFAGCATSVKYSAILLILTIGFVHILLYAKNWLKTDSSKAIKYLVLILILSFGTASFLGGTIYYEHIRQFLITRLSDDGILSELSINRLQNLQLGMVLSSILSIMLCILIIKIRPIRNLFINFLINKKLLLTGTIWVLTFLVNTPFYLFELNNAINDFIGELTPIHLGVEQLPLFQNYFWYIKAIGEGMGGLILVAGLIGMMWVIIHQNQDRRAWLPIFFISTYFLIMANKLRWARWMIPILPFLTIFAGVIIYQLVNLLKNKFSIKFNRISGFYLVLGALLAFPPLIKTLAYDHYITLKDTRAIATEWVSSNIKHGSKIAHDSYTIQVDKKIFFIEHRSSEETRKPLQYYIEQGFDYIIVSSFMYNRYFARPQDYEKNVQFYLDLFKKGRLVKEFLPDPKTIPGPTIKVYDIRDMNR